MGVCARVGVDVFKINKTMTGAEKSRRHCNRIRFHKVYCRWSHQAIHGCDNSVSAASLTKIIFSNHAPMILFTS